jgi:hypothetical protein
MRTRSRSISCRRACRNRYKPIRIPTTASPAAIRNQEVSHQNAATVTATVAPVSFQMPSLLLAFTRNK